MKEKLERIRAKIILNLPLTREEYAYWILYGEREEEHVCI